MIPENKRIRVYAMIQYLWTYGHLDDLPDWIKESISRELEG